MQIHRVGRVLWKYGPMLAYIDDAKCEMCNESLKLESMSCTKRGANPASEITCLVGYSLCCPLRPIYTKSSCHPPDSNVLTGAQKIQRSSLNWPRECWLSIVVSRDKWLYRHSQQRAIRSGDRDLACTWVHPGDTLQIIRSSNVPLTQAYVVAGWSLQNSCLALCST